MDKIMPKITIISLNKEIFCLDKTQTVLGAIHEHSIDWMHACGAKGRCTTWSMIVVKGIENLNEFTKHELFYKSRALLKENERLACQSKVTGDIEILVPESGRLPHLKYID